ncbi:benzoate carboxyl methyltransferase-like [Cornus florida]|uniref:benzoate carboxyl methyltransferase-like n=1 Tax=Cornus florida TaxID=4283 RepID=UPI00289CFF9B|nr:benzoate carboxyl methyltransferase-like [Cornus florida]
MNAGIAETTYANKSILQKARAQLSTMEAKNVLHMNAGIGETSYANNSILQKTIIQKAWPVLEDTLNDMYNQNFPKCFQIADLGCSSGPNTLLVISQSINTIQGLCQRNDCKTPEFQVYLNDLPDNDFNTIFKSLPKFYEEKLKKRKGEELSPCFVSGTPGSFYGRLFPSRSLHFIHSSSSVHWLSKVPERLDNNKGNIYLANTSPSHVVEAYLNQFQSDFSTFLSLRAEEIVPGGRMVLTFRCRSIADPTSKDCRCLWELLAESLLDMVAEGLIDEAKVDSFNLPFHAPYKDEVKAIIHKEGSFTLDKLEVFEVDWDASDKDDDKHFVFDKYRSGKLVASCIRAAMEPILASHFGDTVIDKLFARFAHHVAENQSVDKLKCFNIVVSLTKK